MRSEKEIKARIIKLKKSLDRFQGRSYMHRRIAINKKIEELGWVLEK